MGIEVFFTGLILICLDGELSCPRGNVAWVVKADGLSKNGSIICGRESREETELELRFPSAHFIHQEQGAKCKEDKDDIQCSFLGQPKEICLGPDQGKTQRLDMTLQRVPRIAEVDQRFKKLDMSLIDNVQYVPTRIRFPHGTIGGGDIWPPSEEPRLWQRSKGSDDKTFPRTLSDRLKVTYEKLNKLELTDCHGRSLITLTRKPRIEPGQVTFRNRTKLAPAFDSVDGYDNLGYLVWYYRLGHWDTKDGKCPVYTEQDRDAVVLRCARKPDRGCAYFGPNPDADHTKWPTAR